MKYEEIPSKTWCPGVSEGLNPLLPTHYESVNVNIT